MYIENSRATSIIAMLRKKKNIIIFCGTLEPEKIGKEGKKERSV